MSDDDPTDEEHPPPELVMPFVVCTSQGGPYDDDSFVAGCEFATIDFALRTIRPLGVRCYERYVHPGLIPQLDLLAMHLHWSLVTEPWDEHPDEYALATFDAQAVPE